MEFFKRETRIDFLRLKRAALVLSLALVGLAALGLGLRGLNLGIDFTGGTLVEVAYDTPAELDQVREALAARGFADATVQHFGTARDVLVRLAPRTGPEGQRVDNETLSNRILEALQGDNPQVELRRVEFVGPQVGEELTEKGGLAMLYAIVGILIYVAFRFEYRFAVGAVAALIHDVTITLGFFAWTAIEFDLTVLAALLAVIGYSLNDTIVVFDRIRENFVRVRKGTPVEIANLSINQTLSRTLMTSGTTLLVVTALLLLGGELIAAFSVALIVGIVVGTYSSIYVASAAALALGVSKEDLIPPPKEGPEAEEGP